MSYTDIQYLYNKNHKRIGGSSYLFKNKNHSTNVNILESTAGSGVGYIVLFVLTGIENVPLPQAYSVIYVRHNNGIQIPIMSVMSTFSPILIQLPVVYSPGTSVGPEDDVHSIYDIIITAEGYYTTKILNIRAFDDNTTDFNINMIPAASAHPMLEIERLIELPLFPFQ